MQKSHDHMQSLQNPLKEIKIVNIVCTADLKQKVDIASFNEYEHLSSNLELYRCGYVKDQTMTGRVTVFASGKLISVGTKSINQAHKELEKASKILKKYKIIGSFSLKPCIRNIVANISLNRKLALENLARILPSSMYEPEQFPGIIFRFGGSVVALIFASGKIVLLGSKSYEELNSSFFELNQRLS